MRAGQQLEARAIAVALFGSLVLHTLMLAYLASKTAQYNFDFELTLPAEVEFGIAEGMTEVLAVGPAVTDLDTDPSSDEAQSAGPADPEEQAPEPPANDEAEEKPEDPTQPIPVGPPAVTGPSRLPPGAQLALRIDMERIRNSPLGPDVTAFLMAVPDWQLLLSGSGIDPVEDLDRLLIASPNLERSKLVLAGRHRRGEDFTTASVSQLAKSRGKRAPWKAQLGVRVAPWHNLDSTRRTIAELSPVHFSITRPQDLRRVLALAAARELRNPEEEDVLLAKGPDALLSMGPDEALSVEIEGVPRFVRGNLEAIPERLRVAVRETDADEATVLVLATFASEESAEKAAAYWSRVADFYSEQLVVTLAGFGKTLRLLKLEPSGQRIRFSFTLNADQIRFILSYLEGRLGAAGATSRPPRPSGTPEARPNDSRDAGSTTKKGP